MNWNVNVNTQDGHKVKLSDFIKSVSGASDLLSCLKVVEIEKTYEAGEDISDDYYPLGIPVEPEGIICALCVKVVGQSDKMNVWTGIHYASRLGNSYVDYQDDGCEAKDGASEVRTELVSVRGKSGLNVWYGSGSEDYFKTVIIKAILFLL